MIVSYFFIEKGEVRLETLYGLTQLYNVRR